MDILQQRPIVGSNLPDFKLTGISEKKIKTGIVTFYTEEGDEIQNIPLVELMDYIERWRLNVEVRTTNNSSDGNPTHDVDHEIEIDMLDFLNNDQKLEEATRLYYFDHLLEKQKK